VDTRDGTQGWLADACFSAPVWASTAQDLGMAAATCNNKVITEGRCKSAWSDLVPLRISLEQQRNAIRT